MPSDPPFSRPSGPPFDPPFGPPFSRPPTPDPPFGPPADAPFGSPADPFGPPADAPFGPPFSRPPAPGPHPSLLPAAPPTPPHHLGWVPIDHESPTADDEPRRTSRRTILAHVFTTIVAGFYLLTRLEFDANRPAGSSGSLVPRLWLLAAVVPVVLVHLGIALLQWRAFTYRVGAHRLVIDRGVLTRHHIVIPYDRVQQVDINRRLTAIVLGLAAVRIDTAGMGAHTSIHLRYLDPKAANGLRAFILSHRDGTAGAAGTAGAGEADATAAAGIGAPPTPAPAEETLVALGPKRLVVAALTHHALLTLVPILVVVFAWTMTMFSVTAGKPIDAALWLGAAAVFAGMILLSVVEALMTTVVRHWGFTLSHTGDDLHLRYGLTDQRHLTVPRRRIQHVEVLDNPIRRALGLVSVHLHSAASVAGAGEGHSATRFDIPVLKRAELAVVLPLILGDPHWDIPQLTARPEAARRRAMVRRVAIIAAGVSLPALVAQPYGLAAFAIASLGIPLGNAAHRRAGHTRTPSVAVLAHGVIHHRVVLVPISRLQSARSSATPFQRRLHLQTLHLDVARALRSPQLFDMDTHAADHFRRTLPVPTT